MMVIESALFEILNEFRIVGYLKTGNDQITKVVLWPYRQMSILDQIELTGMDNNEKEWQAVKMTNLYLSNEVAEQTAKDKEFTVDATIVASDIAFTVATAGVYSVGKTALQVGTKVSIGAFSDLAIQISIMSLDGSDINYIMDNIEYDQIAWSGVEGLISNWYTQSLMSCLKNVSSRLSKYDDIVVTKLIEECGTNAIVNLLFDKVYNKKYLDKLAIVISKNPEKVTKKLVEYGLDKETLAWISSKISIDILKFYE